VRIPEPGPYCQGGLRGDTPTSKWILHPYYINTAEIDEGTPIPLGVVAEDTGLYVLSCQCIDPRRPSNDPPAVSTALVRANVDIKWTVDGGGGFVTKVGGRISASATGDHALYQPPPFDTTLVVTVTATVTRRATDDHKPLNASPATSVSFRIWLRVRTDRAQIGGRFAPVGEPLIPLPFCGAPNARLAATTRAFWEGVSTLVSTTAPDRHMPLDIVQHRALIRYRVEPLPYEQSKAPRPAQNEGRCTPYLEFTPPNQGASVNIKTTAFADACVKDMFVVEAEGSFPKRALATQCRGRGCASTPTNFLEVEEVVEYRWNCSRGTFLYSGTGRTAIWIGNEGEAASHVTFEVIAYSILTGAPERLASAQPLTVRLGADWMKAQAAYIAFIDVNEVELPEATFNTPCGGPGDPGSVYQPEEHAWTVGDCVKWATLIDMYLAGPIRPFDVAWEILKRLGDLPELFIGGHAYTYSDSRWQLWKLPASALVRGDLRRTQSWQLVGARHPWRSATWALKTFESNERPPEQFAGGVYELMRTMQRSRDFKHMAGVAFRVLRRRGSIVSVDLELVFDEPGWSRYPGVTPVRDVPYVQRGTYQRGTRVEMPRIEISPLNRNSIAVAMDQTFTIGPRGNTLMAVMTNRTVPHIAVALRVSMDVDSDAAKVIGDVDTGFPTVWTYKNTGGGESVRRVVEERAESGVGQSKVPYMLEQGRQCVEVGAQGL